MIQNVPAERRPSWCCGDRHETVLAPDTANRPSGRFHCKPEETAERGAWIIWPQCLYLVLDLCLQMRYLQRAQTRAPRSLVSRILPAEVAKVREEIDVLPVVVSVVQLRCRLSVHLLPEGPLRRDFFSIWTGEDLGISFASMHSFLFRFGIRVHYSIKADLLGVKVEVLT